MLFKPVCEEPNFREIQLNMLKFWEETHAFRKLVEKNANGPVHSFLDGPITANDSMGVHHARGRTYKDLYLRYKAMQGYRQRYQNGFDCHGLWVEVEVEKELGLQSKRDIESYGLEQFIRACRARVEKYAAIQMRQSIELGQWMDWGNDYYTMSDTNIEYIWGFLKLCQDRGWLYQSSRPMPWCPRCGTSLSQHEMLNSYHEVTHRAVVLKLPLTDGSGERILVWTTTPWTLAANVALAVGEEMEYARVRQGDEVLYVATECLHVLDGNYEVLNVVKGRELAGKGYHGPFDELPAQQGVNHRIVLWDQVSAEEGTGVVHIAPGCGLEDYQLAREIALDVIPATDEAGLYLDTFGELSGQYVSEVAETIFANLAAKGYLYKTEDYIHRYPRCWRCDEELIFRLVDEWFIGVDGLRDKLLAANQTVAWYPPHCQARMADWLSSMGDWCISRKRYWGLPLPFYPCQCGELTVIGSRAELEERASEPIANLPELHRPWIDAVRVICPHCGQPVPRVTEVGDCWLDAGIVPFSTLRYGKDDEYFNTWFPADLVVEMQEQVRLWFYSLLIMAVAIDGRSPYRNCLTYDRVLAEDGREMHKSWGNAIWMDDAFEQMGGDVIRWLYLTQSSDSPLRFGFGIGRDVVRRLTLLWNSYRFFVMYANVDEPHLGRYDEPPTEGLSLLDRWILSRTYGTVAEVRRALDAYETRRAADAIETLWTDLSRWYIRRSRRRMWKAGDSPDKQAAYLTLYHALCTLTRTAAPFMPFLTEEMYQTLVRGLDPSAPESVHHLSYPEPRPDLIDKELEAAVADIQRVINLAVSARMDAQLRIRQPLAELYVVVPEATRPWVRRFVGDIVDEVNVKAVKLAESLDHLKSLRAKPDHRKLGPVFRDKASAIAEAIAALSETQVKQLYGGQPIALEVGGETVEIAPEMVSFEEIDQEGILTKAEDNIAIALNVKLTEALVREGLARDIIRHLQGLRKDAGLELTDRILLTISGDELLTSVCEEHAEVIKAETLALSLEVGRETKGTEVKLGERVLNVQLVKAP
ncbi:MAG: isoleucine--tRNA ligase [Candidatus Zipacnadales bacterium]